MKKNLFSVIIYGWIIAFAIVFATSLILAAFLRFTNFDEPQLSGVTLAFGLLALFLGGLLAGIKRKTKGWLIGIYVGGGFTLTIFLVQYLGYQQPFTWEQSLYHLGYMTAAMIGGVLGVNFTSSEK